MLNTDAFEVTYKSKKTNTNDLDVRDDIEAGAPMGILASISMGLLILALVVLIAVLFYRLRKKKMLH